MQPDNSLRPVLIAGPTASGKSALALALALRDGGVVINADALQVYDCWRVLTARPDAADCARAPHRLYGHVPADTVYSVGAWLRDLAPVLDEARTQRLRPILVGGTGLYFSALTRGLAAIPAVAPEIRARSDALIAAGRLDVLLDRLAAEDPATLARLDVANPRRVQRAWDVLEATGRGLAAWHAAEAPPLLPEAQAITVIIMPQVARLNARIAARFAAMPDAGALAECAAYRARGLPPDLPSARALGAAELVAHLDGRLSRDDAVAAAVTATQQFAKRQRTWFRNRMGHWPVIDPEAEDALALIPPQSAR